MDRTPLGTPWEWGPVGCALLGLAAFAEPGILGVRARRGWCQGLSTSWPLSGSLPFEGRVVLSSAHGLRCASPLTSGWAPGLLPRFGCCEPCSRGHAFFSLGRTSWIGMSDHCVTWGQTARLPSAHPTRCSPPPAAHAGSKPSTPSLTLVRAFLGHRQPRGCGGVSTFLKSRKTKGESCDIDLFGLWT